MIAAAVKTDKEKGVLSPLFGKAKFFSIIDDVGNITTYKNTFEGGMKVARWIKGLGVTTLIANHLGEKPFHALQNAGIKVYFAGKERIELHDALEKMKAGELEEVNSTNYMALLGEEADENNKTHAKHSCCGHSHRHRNEYALSKKTAHRGSHFHL